MKRDNFCFPSLLVGFRDRFFFHFQSTQAARRQQSFLRWVIFILKKKGHRLEIFYYKKLQFNLLAEILYNLLCALSWGLKYLKLKKSLNLPSFLRSRRFVLVVVGVWKFICEWSMFVTDVIGLWLLSRNSPVSAHTVKRERKRWS